jgi:hypothetical protein
MPVTISDIDAINIQQALDSARSFISLFDLQESIRKLNRQNRSSPLTLALDDAYERITRYLEPEGDNDGVQ